MSQVAEQLDPNAETEAELMIQDLYFEFSSQVTKGTGNRLAGNDIDKLEHQKH